MPARKQAEVERPDSATTDEELLSIAREVVAVECEALSGLSVLIDESFVRAVRMIVASRGAVIVCGIGKSGIVARKMAATFASTGTPSIYLHPVEAAHGDIGVVGSGDIVIAVSKSGEAEELSRLMPLFAAIDVPVIAITGNRNSRLASGAEVILHVGVPREACPMDLVPTSSTIAALAMGDALAVAVLKEKKVDQSRFAFFHPGGALGKRLLLRVSEVMHTGDELPSVQESASMREAILEIVAKRLGVTAVVDGDGKLVGIVTDGDLKRILIDRADILEARVGDVMIPNPKTIGRDELVASALEMMETVGPSPITSLIILDGEGAPEGVIHIHDCLAAVG